ncbi:MULTISPECIES: tyrosine-type recombinase/integrase [Aeromonas]|uniref:Integrase arm-type DNA-binding domain-containing protein n=1 Tax=Aeromonas sp. 19NY04SH05-1 TaxID=2920537 RepID=A0AAU6T5B6_9GAMM|nr:MULTISPECIES: site-specific integrase [Aeromonas]MBZ6073106.1 integrase arm-type DNA-binding domain-containing protein [Aeromonas schubertii]
MAITTDAEIAAIKPESGVIVRRMAIQSKHGGGLKLEVRTSGIKRFVYRYKIAGKAGEMLLGGYPAMTLAKARQAHGKAAELVKQGIDPLTVTKQAKAKNIEMPTLGEIYRDWLVMRAKSKPIGPRTLRDYEGTFTRHIESAIGNTRVCDLSRAVLYEHFRRVETAEGARKGLIVLNQCLDHAVLQGHIEINPARLLKPAMFGASMPPPRERWLTRDELRQLWGALEQATAGGGSVAAGGRGIASNVVLSLAVANCLRLITLTAVRRSEAVGMRWEQINGDRWTIPETKNGRAHVVTLCPLALDIIEQQKALSNGPYVFESTSKTGHPITGDAVTKALERVRIKYLAELAPFSPHDLRRSMATGAAEYLDAPERLIELMLNHVPKDRLIRTYQVGGMAEKLRALFLRWGDFMATITQPEQAKPGNVVSVNFGGRG